MEQEHRRVYICFGTPDKHLEKIEQATQKLGRFDWWNIKKSACKEDIVIFYMIRPMSAFVATGIVDSEVQQCPDKDSQWHDQPCVWVRDVSLLHRHVPLSKAKKYFSEWKFLKQPRRSTDVPKSYVGQFLRLLGVQGQDQFRPPEEIPSGSKYS